MEPSVEETWRSHLISPIEWQLSAIALKAAADLVRDKCQRSANDTDADYHLKDVVYGRTYMFLMALAVENALKAIIVAQRRSELIGCNKLPPWLNTHDLTSLYRSSNLSQIARHSSTLEKLKHFIIAGRYPVSNKPLITNTAYMDKPWANARMPYIDMLWRHLLEEMRKEKVVNRGIP